MICAGRWCRHLHRSFSNIDRKNKSVLKEDTLKIENTLKMAKQFGIIFGCLFLGELLGLIPGMAIPGSIWGMLILTFMLSRGWVKAATIKPVCRFLIDNMAFFFIPPGVALMLYFDLIASEFIPILVATVASIIIVLIVTGRLHQYLHSRSKHHHQSKTKRSYDVD